LAVEIGRQTSPRLQIVRRAGAIRRLLAAEIVRATAGAVAIVLLSVPAVVECKGAGIASGEAEIDRAAGGVGLETGAFDRVAAIGPSWRVVEPG
jgi:hypothetical protein